MDFALNEEQQALQKLAREFTAKEITPVAAHWDERGEVPMELIKKMHETGLMNIQIPEKYGGGGLGYLESCLVGEELAYGCTGISTTPMAHSLAITPILLAGTEEQKQKMLKPICEEFGLAAFCLTEPGAGSDAGAVATTARLDGDHYVINGTKCFITNGSLARLYTVFASEDRTKGLKGLSAFLVPAGPGVKAGKEEKKLGQRASNTTEVVFDDVRIPRANLIGKSGEGFKIAMMTLDNARAACAAAATGLSRRALDEAVRYSNERVQFGQPISAQQAIQFILADMAMKVETSRLMYLQAAWMTDQKMKQTVQSAMAKCLCADTAMDVSTMAIQVFGGYGYMKDYPVEKLMRDAKLMQIYEGTNQIQRVVIGRGLTAAASRSKG
ncbi:MAG: acyl-CoA dehydrogenase family protein [Candidatus Riflebacteria bacterium]|nr:acyl-CoA dehydrogenase family protein [Candidatus Riflebacteria bacterium]